MLRIDATEFIPSFAPPSDNGDTCTMPDANNTETTPGLEQCGNENFGLGEYENDRSWQQAKKPSRCRKKPSRCREKPLSSNSPSSVDVSCATGLNCAKGTLSIPFSSNNLADAMKSIAKKDKVMILMRGCPGSGKSTLARSILVESQSETGLVLSTDEYFMRNLEYIYDKSLLHDAHKWNYQRAIREMENDVTPIIIDNTNVVLVDMKNYVFAAVSHGYQIFFIEPTTKWRFKPGILVQKCLHNVHIENIRRMVDNYNHNVSLRSFYGMIKQRFGARIAFPDNLSSTFLGTSGVPEPISTNFVCAEELCPEPRRNCLIDELWKSDNELNLNNSSSQDNHKNQEMSWDDDGFVATASWETVPTENVCETSNKSDQTESSPFNFDVQNNLDSVAADNSKDISLPLNSNAKDNAVEGSSKEVSLSPLRRNRKKESNLVLALTNNALNWRMTDFAVSDLASTVYSGLPAQQNCCVSPSFDVISRPAQTNYSYSRSNDLLLFASQDHHSGSEFADTVCEIRSRCIISSLTCQAGVQTQEMSSDEESLNYLESAFPDLPRDYLCDVLISCHGNCDWAMNLLLSSAQTCGDSSFAGDLPAGPVNTMLDSGLSNDAAGFSVMSAANSANDVVDDVYMLQPLSGSEEETGDFLSSTNTSSGYGSDSGLLPMELGSEMARQLQELFGPVIQDAPELANPEQLRVYLPVELAEQLYSCWCSTLQHIKKSPNALVMSKSVENDMLKEDEIMAYRLQCEEDFAACVHLSNKDYSEPENGTVLPVNDEGITSLRQVMAEEMAAERSLKNMSVVHSRVKNNSGGFLKRLSLSAEQQTYAHKMKLHRLVEMFPSIDSSVLDDVLSKTGFSLETAVETLVENFCVDELMPSTSGNWQMKSQQEEDLMGSDAREECVTEDDIWKQLRDTAVAERELSRECFAKATSYHRRPGMGGVALYYSQEGHLHHRKLKEANRKAAEKILALRRKSNPPDVLDLHGLFVPEAMAALSAALKENYKRMGAGCSISVITGSGSHSREGQPKLKPCVLSYLRSRNYRIEEVNAGMLRVSRPDVRQAPQL